MDHDGGARRAIDRLRAASTAQRTAATVGALQALQALQDADAEPDNNPVSDDQLRLVFLCCHPALALDAQVALTLRVVNGLSTASIARAFLVPETTMAQRLVTGQAEGQEAAHIPFLPAVAPRCCPIVSVPQLAVVYLVFNEGYRGDRGRRSRTADSCATEAIRLGRLLLDLLPDEPEARGLLALMLLHHSRARPRIDANGAQAPLEEQDRSRWDRGRDRRRTRTRRAGPFPRAAGSAARYRHPSPRCTPKPQIWARRTGVRSPRSTTCSPIGGRRPLSVEPRGRHRDERGRR